MFKMQDLDIKETKFEKLGVDKIKYEFKENQNLKSADRMKLVVFKQKFRTVLNTQLERLKETKTNKYIMSYCAFLLTNEEFDLECKADVKKMFMLDMFNENNDVYNIRSNKLMTDDLKMYKYDYSNESFVEIVNEEEKKDRNNIKRLKTNKLDDLNKYVSLSNKDPLNNDGLTGVFKYWHQEIQYTYEEWLNYYKLKLPNYDRIDVKINNARSCAKSCLWFISVLIFLAAIFGSLAAIITSIKQ